MAARRGVTTAPRAGSHRGGPLWIGGQPIWTGLDIHGIRYRFEERAQESALAHELGLCPSPRAPAPVLPRQSPSGGPLPTDDPVPAVQAINLIVLRDARALSTRAAFLHMLAERRSVHLSIDWDGTIYQHLDLARAATQPDLDALAGVGARSVVVALINPGDPASPPTPSPTQPPNGTTGATSRRTREVVSGLVQGQAVRRWSYTDAQRASLSQLITALRAALPEIPARLPEDDQGAVPRAALPAAARRGIQGVVGALHLTAKASDPGPDLGWARLREALNR